jgi:hypothetical protein
MAAIFLDTSVLCALVVAGQLPTIGLEFWTADGQQAQAARAEGLVVELVS